MLCKSAIEKFVMNYVSGRRSSLSAILEVFIFALRSMGNMLFGPNGIFDRFQSEWIKNLILVASLSLVWPKSLHALSRPGRHHA